MSSWMDKMYLKNYWPWMLLFVNLAVGLIFCFLIFPRLVGNSVTQIDPDGFGKAGRIWYETGSFNSVEKAPLYPLSIAIVSSLVGKYHVAVIQIFQCILSAFTCLILAHVFQLIITGRDAFWASFVWTLYPLSIWYIPRLWTETWLTSMVSLYTYSLVYFLQKPGLWRAVFCGVLVSLVSMSKGIGLIFAVITPFIFLWKFRARSLRYLIPFFSALGLIVGPWTIRNWQKTGHIIPIHVNAGYNFLLGNGFVRNWSKAPLSYIQLKKMTLNDHESQFKPDDSINDDPFLKDQLMIAIALDEIIQRPSLILKKIVTQGFTFWYLAANKCKSILTGFLQIPIVLFSVIGMIKAFKAREKILILIVPIFGIMGGSVVIFAFGRLSAPIMPYVIFFAVYGLVQSKGGKSSNL